ncbi:hypothetical protein BSL78_20282 [Apostichopus japonicus]|uniref:Uncharacterized protein n=1 Tax=Stichopus japonicus TaxID=307972 RepID=A0A2G8K4B8_STIJA|nr:hypothetical protein BSL78_20282 [Apostichopus japonicus]
MSKVLKSFIAHQFPEMLEKGRVEILLLCHGIKAMQLWICNRSDFIAEELVAKIHKKLEACKQVSFSLGVTIRIQSAEKITRENVLAFMKVKQSVIQCKNVDNLGAARAIVLAFYHPHNENHPQWKSLCHAMRSNKVLTDLAKEFHIRSKVPIKNSLGVSDYARFQNVLPHKYRLVVLTGPWTQDVTYSGPIDRHVNLYIFCFEDVTFMVTSPSGLYGCIHFCNKCFKQSSKAKPTHTCPYEKEST